MKKERPVNVLYVLRDPLGKVIKVLIQERNQFIVRTIRIQVFLYNLPIPDFFQRIQDLDFLIFKYTDITQVDASRYL